MIFGFVILVSLVVLMISEVDVMIIMVRVTVMIRLFGILMLQFCLSFFDVLVLFS